MDNLKNKKYVQRRGCCITLCENNIKNFSGKEQNYELYSFPKNPVKRKKWVKFFKVHNVKVNPEFHRICNLHFKEDNFERNLMSELLLGKPKRNLLPNVIPSIYIRKVLNETGEARKARKDKNSRKAFVNEILKEHDLKFPENTANPPNDNWFQFEEISVDDQQSLIEDEIQPCGNCQELQEQYLNDNSLLKQKLDESEKQNAKNLVELDTLRNTITQLENEIAQLQDNSVYATFNII